MDVRRELWLGFGALIFLSLSLAFASIGLFGRMGPAVSRVLEDNVGSITAAQDVLVLLAHSPEQPLSRESKMVARERIKFLEENITEHEESALVAAMLQELDDTAEGDLRARAELIRHTAQLMEVNRLAMRRADATARRLGTAGAWVSVGVGSMVFAVGLLIMSRIRRRIILPLQELYAVLEQAKQGNWLRRCREGDAPVEIRLATSSVNELLDTRFRHDTTEGTLVESALLGLLDRQTGAAGLIDGEGRVLKANPRLLDALSGESPVDLLRDETFERVAVGNGYLVLRAS